MLHRASQQDARKCPDTWLSSFFENAFVNWAKRRRILRLLDFAGDNPADHNDGAKHIGGFNLQRRDPWNAWQPSPTAKVGKEYYG
jgi:hypothetical protein